MDAIHFGKTRHTWKGHITYTARCGESGITGAHITYTHTKLTCFKCICVLLRTKHNEIMALESKLKTLMPVDTPTAIQ